MGRRLLAILTIREMTMNKLRAVGGALMAALAIGAFGTQGASAQNFTGNEFETTITANRKPPTSSP